jgi:hypothetical protein
VNEKLRAKEEEVAATVRAELAAGKAPAEIATALAAPYASLVTNVPVLAVVRDADLDKAAEGDAGAPARTIEGAGARKASEDDDRPSGGESSTFGPGQEAFAGLASDGVTKVASFAMTAAVGSVAPEVAPLEDGFAVVKLVERKEADAEAFKKDREAYIARYTQAKRLEALALYLKRARDRSKTEITIDPNYANEPAEKTGASESDETTE